MIKIENFATNRYGDYKKVVNGGGRFICFPFCISILIYSTKRYSGTYLIRDKKSHLLYSAGFFLMTLVLGWWAIPMGPIYTIQALIENAKGGNDVTNYIMEEVSKMNPGNRFY